MKNLFLATLAVVFLSLTNSLSAQSHSRVTLSNSDPRWGEVVMVTYTAPDSSVYKRADFKDTVYMAVVFSSAWGEQNVVNAMERKGSSGVYQSAFSVPDSTYVMRIEICEPTDRVPDGIEMFTAQMPDGARVPGSLLEEAADVDSALKAELRHYPTHFEAYLTAFSMIGQQMSESATGFETPQREEVAGRFIAALEKSEPKNLSWILSMARMMAQRADRKEEAKEYYKKAGEYTRNDELLWDAGYWQNFLGPMMVDKQMRMPYERGRYVMPLALRFPKSEFARVWIRRMSYDTLLDRALYDKLVSNWVNSSDVDVLTSIADGYMYKSSSLYNPATALEWINRAEKAHKSRAGFYSGENIFGSMGRWSRVMSIKMNALTAQGHAAEAILIGRTALHSVSEQYEKDELRGAMMRASLAFHDVQSAERYLGSLLASSTRRSYPELDTIYAQRKNEGESRDDYTKRIARMGNGAEKLPAIQDFAFRRLDGSEGNTASFRGKIVVLDFWFVGCAGCAMERSSLDGFARTIHADTNVAVLSVALNDAEALKKYLKTSTPDFPVVPNGQAICDMQGVQGYPTHVILDRKGHTLVWEVGGTKDSGDLLLKRVKEILAQQ